MKSRNVIIPIFIPQEGCPHKCVFCNQETISGEENRVTAVDVVNTIEEYLPTINKENTIVEVSFFGGTFTGIPIEKQKELLSVAKEYKDNGSIDKIRMSTRPDYIDRKILEHLKNYDVDIIELGVQSLDEEVLRKSGRGHTIEDVYEASSLIKEYGITLGHQMMLGLPGDSFEKDIETTKRIIEMKPALCRIYPSLVIKNTPMEKMLNMGIYKPYTLEEAIDICKVVYKMLIDNDIEVIRVGLQTTNEINYDGDILDGPFHPAFRELVEGSIYCDIIKEEYREGQGDIEIKINEKDISKLYCNKKKYFNEVRNMIKEKVIVKIDNDISRGEILISQGGKCRKKGIKKSKGLQ